VGQITSKVLVSKDGMSILFVALPMMNFASPTLKKSCGYSFIYLFLVDNNYQSWNLIVQFFSNENLIVQFYNLYLLDIGSLKKHQGSLISQNYQISQDSPISQDSSIS